jgi:hypothetical protein
MISSLHKNYLPSKFLPMNKILCVAATIIIFSACSSGDSKKGGLPEKPASVKTVQDGVKGKKYITERVGTHGVFSNDSSIQWLEPKKEDKFEQEIVNESKTFQLTFVSDTSVTVMMKDKTHNGTYAINDIVNENEKLGIKLRISYVDEEFKFGDGPASKVTYTYLVEGINEKSLLLETPRSMNNRTIVLLMNKQ